MFTIEYIYLFIFTILSLIISTIVFFLSYLLINKQYDLEKLSAYECGFQPFEDARTKFNVKYYLVAILFIIFDLEVSYLFPWAIYLNNTNSWLYSIDNYSFFWMLLFLVILTIGFIYEWLKGALEWN